MREKLSATLILIHRGLDQPRLLDLKSPSNSTLNRIPDSLTKPTCFFDAAYLCTSFGIEKLIIVQFSATSEVR
jgi:hypothetical protein